ncbi:MAG: hypothetical protein IT285_05235 [Bdellovibrionales bacterium]|nr:hypothetical protein [Bdellovibrionales bacterium]
MAEQKTESGVGYKRRWLLINPRFQLIMLAYSVGLAALAIGIFYGANLLFFSDFYAKGESLGLPRDHVFFQFIDMQKGRMNWIYVLTSLVVLGTMCIAGLIMSHRVAGPLYRMRNHMTAVADGKTTADLTFRKGDFFQELPGLYNAQKTTLMKGSGKKSRAA